jgi:hypothetical protein
MFKNICMLSICFANCVSNMKTLIIRNLKWRVPIIIIFFMLSCSKDDSVRDYSGEGFGVKVYKTKGDYFTYANT